MRSKLEGVGLTECLDALSERWKESVYKAKTFNKKSKVIKKGVGLGSCWYGCGNTALTKSLLLLKVGIDKFWTTFPYTKGLQI